MSSISVFDFKSQFETLLQTEAKDLSCDFSFVTIASNNKPWFDTGITLVRPIRTFVYGKLFSCGMVE